MDPPCGPAIVLNLPLRSPTNNLDTAKECFNFGVDSIFIDDNIKYASATKQISIFDRNEKLQILGEFAEIFEEKDSAIVTLNPMAINTTEIDSLFISADTLYSIGNRKNRICLLYTSDAADE